MMNKSLALVLLACGLAFGQQTPSVPGLNVTTANPSAPTNCSAGNVGATGSTTYYYWAIANYPIGQAISTSPITVSNAPTLSGSDYIVLSCQLPAYASSVDFLRTTTPQLSSVGTQSLAVATGTSGTANDQGGALASYTFNNVVGTVANLRLNNRDFSSPRLEWAIGNGVAFGPLPSTSGGNGLAITPPGTNGAEGIVYTTAHNVPVGNLNGGTGYFLVAGITGKTLTVVNFVLIARGGSIAGCTDIRIGDSNNANAIVIDPVANLTVGTGNTAGTSTIAQSGFGATPFGAGLGINVFKTGAACTTATSFDAMVGYTINPSVN